MKQSTKQAPFVQVFIILALFFIMAVGVWFFGDRLQADATVSTSVSFCGGVMIQVSDNPITIQREQMYNGLSVVVANNTSNTYNSATMTASVESDPNNVFGGISQFNYTVSLGNAGGESEQRDADITANNAVGTAMVKIQFNFGGAGGTPPCVGHLTLQVDVIDGEGGSDPSEGVDPADPTMPPDPEGEPGEDPGTDPTVPPDPAEEPGEDPGMDPTTGPDPGEEGSESDPADPTMPPDPEGEPGEDPGTDPTVPPDPAEEPGEDPGMDPTGGMCPAEAKGNQVKQPPHIFTGTDSGPGATPAGAIIAAKNQYLGLTHSQHDALCGGAATVNNFVANNADICGIDCKMKENLPGVPNVTCAHHPGVSKDGSHCTCTTTGSAPGTITATCTCYIPCECTAECEEKDPGMCCDLNNFDPSGFPPLPMCTEEVMPSMCTGFGQIFAGGTTCDSCDQSLCGGSVSTTNNDEELSAGPIYYAWKSGEAPIFSSPVSCSETSLAAIQSSCINPALQNDLQTQCNNKGQHFCPFMCMSSNATFVLGPHPNHPTGFVHFSMGTSSCTDAGITVPAGYSCVKSLAYAMCTRTSDCSVP